MMCEVKMFLFGRWMSINYSTDILNSEDGYWWKEQLNFFNEIVYPNYIKNGTVDNTKRFLESTKIIKGVFNDLP